MSTLRTPSIAGRLMMVDIEGQRLDAATADFLRQHHIRAVCLFRKNLGSEEDIRALTSALRAVMGSGALIAMDQEGGSVVRAITLPQAPGAMALGATGDAVLAERVGAAVARGLRHLGINWNFAPVLDVNNNPANPVIGERSFSADAHEVARLAGAWMRGAHGEGVACCVKHFPGHGDTHTDSHHALPVVDKTIEQLEALELLPFRTLAAQAPSVMSAHILYPRIDPELPATLSPALLGGLLRQRIGFDGVVITDALMMEAVHARWGTARAAVLALKAGADMPLAQGTREEQAAVLKAIDDALTAGTLDRAALERSVQRLDTMARRFPAPAQDLSNSQRDADRALMQLGWSRALTGVGSPQVPAPHTPLRVVTQGEVVSDGVSEAGVAASTVRRLFESFADVEWVEVPDLANLEAAALQAVGRQVVLVSNQRARYAVSRSTRRADLHLVLWNPFQTLDIAAPALVSWGHADGALAAVKAWLEGRAGTPGVSPVPLAPATS